MAVVLKSVKLLLGYDKLVDLKRLARCCSASAGSLRTQPLIAVRCCSKKIDAKQGRLQIAA